MRGHNCVKQGFVGGYANAAATSQATLSLPSSGDASGSTKGALGTGVSAAAEALLSTNRDNHDEPVNHSPGITNRP